MSDKSLGAADAAVEYLASALHAWRPWVDPETGESPQREAVRALARSRVVSYRAGNRTGKTTVMAWNAVAFWAGWHPFAHASAPRRVWCSALDWAFGVGEVMWPTMRDLVPWDRVRDVTYIRRQPPEIPSALYLDDGSLLVFKSAESGRRKYQGTPQHLIWIDEEHPADVVQEARARLLDSGGWLLHSATPVDRARYLVDLEQEPGTVVVRASMLAAARAGLLDHAAVERYLASLPEQQRRVREYGDFARVEGLVYPSYTPDVHHVEPRGNALVWRGHPVTSWPLPATWPRYASMDFGFSHPTAVVVAALDPQTETLYVERCYYQSQIRASVWAEFLQRELPRLATPVVCDHDADGRAELEARGVATVPARKEIVPGVEAVERWLHPDPDRGGRPRLLLVHHGDAAPAHPMTGRCDAEPLARELRVYRYPPPARGEVAADRKDLPLKRDDHACDALRYLVMHLEHGRRGVFPVIAGLDGGPRSRAADALRRSRAGRR